MKPFSTSKGLYAKCPIHRNNLVQQQTGSAKLQKQVNSLLNVYLRFLYYKHIIHDNNRKAHLLSSVFYCN